LKYCCNIVVIFRVVEETIKCIYYYWQFNIDMLLFKNSIVIFFCNYSYYFIRIIARFHLLFLYIYIYIIWAHVISYKYVHSRLTQKRYLINVANLSFIYMPINFALKFLTWTNNPFFNIHGIFSTFFVDCHLHGILNKNIC